MQRSKPGLLSSEIQINVCSIMAFLQHFSEIFPNFNKHDDISLNYSLSVRLAAQLYHQEGKHGNCAALNLTHCCVQISTCQYKGMTRIDLFACDDIEAAKSLFYSPRRLNKGEVFSVSESRL